MSEGGGKEAQSAPYQARVDEEHSQDEYAQPELQAEGIESDDAQDEENQESGNVVEMIEEGSSWHSREEEPRSRSPSAVWIKVHYSHILPETLDHYNLPWEWDNKDPEYILIKKWLTERLQGMLFEHTRRIRERKHPERRREVYNYETSYDTDEPLDDEEDIIISSHRPGARIYRSAITGGMRPRTETSDLPDSLSFDVNLKNPNVKLSVNEYRSDKAHREYASQRIDVASSRMPGYGKVALCRSEKTDHEPQFSWIHMNTEMRNFSDFMRFASNVPNLAAEDRALVLSLLKKAQSKMEGSNQPRDVMRCIGLNSKIQDKITNEKCAILVRFPYYSIQKMETATQSRYDAGDKPRSLLQYHYNFESTRKRDLEQIVRKSGLFPRDHILHVLQMWAVIVNFRFIITSAPIPLIEQGTSSLEIVDPPVSNLSSSPSVICVVDPRQRVFFFPIENCKTFLAMRHNVTEYCLSEKFQERHYDFELLTSNMKVIEAEDWVQLTTTHASAILRIHVQILSPDPPKRRYGEAYDNESEGSDANSGYHRESANRRRAYTPKYSLSSSGVVVNQRSIVQRPNDTKSAVSNIYIPAEKTVSFANEPRNRRKENRHEERNSGEEPRPMKRAVTFGSLFGESLVSYNQPAVDKKPIINMRFPPVFTWPVGKRPSTQSEDSDDQTNTLSAPESDEKTQSLDEETIKHVCSHIDGELQESDRDRRRKIYEEASAMSFFEVDKIISQRWAISFSTIISAGQVKKTTELPPWEMTLKEVVSGLCRLFNFFIPLGYPCVIGDKFWGAINDLVTIIPQICDTFGMLELTERTRHPNMPALFYIVDITSKEHADLREMADVDVLIKDIKLCNKCEKSRAYSTQSDAWGHLFKYHFKASSKQREVIISRSQWVMDHGEYLTFTCRNDVQRLLNELNDYITSLERMASQIQHGVSENGKFDRDTYKIPSSLVDGFQNFVMMVVTGAHAVKSSYQLREVYTDFNTLPTVVNFLESDRIINLATEAEEAMGNAMKDIVLMAFTNEESEVVTYEAVSPSLVITLLLGDIRYSNHGNLHLIDIYETYIQFLQFKAGEYPSRRLMQEIYTFREELLMVEKIAQEQRQILHDYRSVLRPSTFRITTESRISSFKLENKHLSKLLDRIDGDCELIQTLLDRLDSIATQTRNGLEVRQEDQGKAILVFTIVTVVFMPLSFVTSYLGMNTNDIRNMENSQKLFWIVSIPLTVFIIAAVLLVAFQVDRLREALEILFSRDYVQPVTKSANSLSGEKERRENQKENEFFHSSPSVGSSSKQWFGRRRSVKWMATSADSSFA